MPTNIYISINSEGELEYYFIVGGMKKYTTKEVYRRFIQGY